MFRRRPQRKIFLCFYCNTPSTLQVDQSHSLRKWHCSNCEQTNHLDENGEIADYIPSTEASPVAPLRPTSSSSPCVPPPLPSPFCDTCISNQTLLTKNLASFLPAEDHPDYDAYAAALPAYTAELEEKYPQVCADCEERVRNRLQRNNYLAKTSALGGFLKRRRREAGILEIQWGVGMWFKVCVWWIRGGLWWISSIVFLVWCILGFIAPETVGAVHKPVIPFNRPEPFRAPLPPSISTFLHHLLPRQYVLPIPRFIAMISPFVVMWDYKWLQAQSIPGAQVDNLTEYRELQFIVLIIRIMPFLVLRLTNEASVVTWISPFLGILSLLGIWWSLGILKVRYPPEIALQDNSTDEYTPQSTPSPSRISSSQYTFERTQPTTTRQSPSKFQQQPPSSSFASTVSHFPRSVSLPPNQPLSSHARNPLDLSSLGLSDPLPPYGGTETMDWIPSSNQETSFSPSRTSHQRIPFSTRGLPPAPGTIFSPTQKESKTNYFRQTRESPDSVLFGATSQHIGQPEEVKTGGRQGKGEIELQPQRYFAKQDSTGLEALMGQALKLDDEPTLVRAVKAVRRSMMGNERLKRGYINLGISVVVIVLVLGWRLGGRGLKGGVGLGFMILGGGRILARRIHGKSTGKGLAGDVLLGALSLLFATMLLIPISGLRLPDHPFLLRLFESSFQTVLLRLGVLILVGVFAKDTANVIQLRLDLYIKAKKEEELRQAKLRGIFYTPLKRSQSDRGSRNGDFAGGSGRSGMTGVRQAPGGGEGFGIAGKQSVRPKTSREGHGKSTSLFGF